MPSKTKIGAQVCALSTRNRGKYIAVALHGKGKAGLVIFTNPIPSYIIRKKLEINKHFFEKSQCFRGFSANFCKYSENFHFFSFFFIENTI